MNEKNEYLPIGTEYSFSIYDKDGTEVKLDHGEEHGDSSTTFEIKKSKEQALKVGERYALVETKAPAGFELLAEAVAFTVQRAEDGELGLEIEDAHRHPQVQVLTLGDKQDENSVYFAVADMRQGDLPASGDRGVFWTLGLGIAALIAAAGATLRRRA
nr:SpaA isopeptide-forming pilin-related protein [Corynebacterium singulare]